jgi:hypothetical protein
MIVSVSTKAQPQPEAALGLQHWSAVISCPGPAQPAQLSI